MDADDVVEIVPPSPPSISRRTRSHAAPEWTAQEMLTLANEVAAVEEDCRRALSSFQRWEIVAENCSAILGGAPRSAQQCRRRWDAMLADYRRVQAWEEEGKKRKPSYWSLGSDGRRAALLPVDFDREVFGAIARSLRAQERGVDAAGDVASESEQQAGEDGDGDDDVIVVKEMPKGSTKAVPTSTKSSKTAQWAQGMSCEVQDKAQRVHAILRGELSEGSGAGEEVDLNKPSAAGMESTRRQADELIKALASLIGSLEQFTEGAREEEEEDDDA